MAKKNQSKKSSISDIKEQENIAKQNIIRVNKKPNLRWILFIGLIVIGIFAVLYSKGVFKQYLSNTDDDGVMDDSVEGFEADIVDGDENIKYAASVNGELISFVELNENYDQMQLQMSISKMDFLNQTIKETLLLQEAEKTDIVIEDEEIEEVIDMLIIQNGMDREQFDELLALQGMDYDELKNYYKKEMLIVKFLNESIFTDILPTDDEIQDYYDEYKEIYFLVPAARNVSHILVCHNESLRCDSYHTKDEAMVQAEMILELIDDENFARIAAEYSEEPAANETYGNLGLITMSSLIDPVFLNVSFGLEIGEVSDITETQFGYHIIKVFDEEDEGYIPYEEVSSQISSALVIEKQQLLFNEYMDELYAGADIEIYDIE